MKTCIICTRTNENNASWSHNTKTKQLEHCRKFAKRNKVKIIQEFELKSSDTNVLLEAIAYACKNNADYLLIDNAAILASNAFHFKLDAAICLKFGRKLFSASVSEIV